MKTLNARVWCMVLPIFVLTCVMTGCRVRDDQSLAVVVPELTGEADVQRIRTALRQYSGVKTEGIKADFTSKTVYVPFDAMRIAHKNIEFAIAEAGFTANGITVPASEK